jgi:hypothetical protein
MLRTVGEDRLKRRDLDLGIGRNCVGAAGVELLERVGCITRQHHVATRVVDADHRNVAWCVAGGRDRHDTSVITQRPASTEGPKRTIIERERLGREAWRERLAQQPAGDPSHR